MTKTAPDTPCYRITTTTGADVMSTSTPRHRYTWAEARAIAEGKTRQAIRLGISTRYGFRRA